MPAKPRTARAAAASSTPSCAATASALTTFATLCAPRSGISSRSITACSRPSSTRTTTPPETVAPSPGSGRSTEL